MCINWIFLLHPPSLLRILDQHFTGLRMGDRSFSNWAGSIVYTLGFINIHIIIMYLGIIYRVIWIEPSIILGIITSLNEELFNLISLCIFYPVWAQTWSIRMVLDPNLVVLSDNLLSKEAVWHLCLLGRGRVGSPFREITNWKLSILGNICGKL